MKLSLNLNVVSRENIEYVTGHLLPIATSWLISEGIHYIFSSQPIKYTLQGCVYGSICHGGTIVLTGERNSFCFAGAVLQSVVQFMRK